MLAAGVDRGKPNVNPVSIMWDCNRYDHGIWMAGETSLWSHLTNISLTYIIEYIPNRGISSQTSMSMSRSLACNLYINVVPFRTLQVLLVNLFDIWG
jgi:hypothetical protein